MCLDINGLANGNDGPCKDEASLLAPADSEPITLGKTDADILWVFNVLTNAGTYPHDGACSAPVLLGNTLYFNTCNGVDNTHRKIRKPEAPSLIALDKNTGKYQARDNENIGPLIFHSTWAAPALGEVNGQKQIIFGGGNGVVYAFEPVSDNSANNEVASLKKIWQFDCDPTAPKTNVHRFTSNRTTSPSNIKGTPVFCQNRVYVTVGGDLWWGKNQAWLKCIDATKKGDITQSGEIWSYPLDRHSMSTPSIADGLVYVADCRGKIHCVDAETGAPYWVHETESENWASTLVADGKVYLGTRSGVFWVLAAGKEKKVIAKIEMDSAISATTVAANGVLYVTTMRNLYAIQK
jgi:outer membrane protein assembly factor BamB